MISASSLLTHNFYRLVVRGRPEKHYVLTGRLLGAVVVIGGAVIATMFESIFAQIKFLWEFYAIFAASFWLGMLWRRATRAAAWSSILFSLFAFFLLPLLLPLFVPGLRSNEYLTRMTQPRVIQREYNAREMDVQNRMDDIQRWEALPPEKQAQKERPEPLKLGEAFTKTYQVEARSIFWTQGIKTDDEGVRRGRGMLNLGLLTLYWLGWDLTTNPFALNETLRILLRTILPFLIIFIASFMTRHRDERALDRFYAKMRTPVQTDREADRLELEKALSHPESTLHMKMFPHSQWEIRKWNKVDVLGFLISVAVAFGIIGLLFLVVSIGG
jgi:SSS family solute:Na+ symporter